MTGECKIRRVVVTGIGAVCCLGDTVEEMFGRLLAGESGIRFHDDFAGRGCPVTHGGAVSSVSFDTPKRDFLIAEKAIGDALAQADLSSPPDGLGLLWGASLDTVQRAKLGVESRDAGSCVAEIMPQLTGVRRAIATACSASTQAIGEAFHLIRTGRQDVCVAGGSCVMLTDHYLAGFAALGAVAPDGDRNELPCRPFDKKRCGFSLGDGAGALVLEAHDSAARRGAKPLGEILGFGTSQDAFDLNSPPPDGGGALLCLKRALDDANSSVSDIDAINAHGTGTIVGDAAETNAIRSLLAERWREVPVVSTKGALGHAMGAAGALEAIVALLSSREGVLPPTTGLSEPAADCELFHVIGAPRVAPMRRVLSASFGMGGQNAAILLTGGVGHAA